MSRDDLAVGIDFGGTKVAGAVVDRRGKILAEHRVPTPHQGAPLLDSIADLVKELEKMAGNPVHGVGIGAAGLVDRKGVLHYGPNVGGVTDVDVQGGVAERLPGYRVRVDNDANVAAWGECLFGAGRRASEMIMVTLGTGVGGGLVSSGRIFRGANGFATEFGHITVESEGILCNCGRRGCWEAYGSGRALGRMGRDAAADAAFAKGIELAGSAEAIKGEDVVAAARAGDPAALGIFREFAGWVAIGLADLIAMLDPAVIVVGGGLAGDQDLYMPHVRSRLKEITFGENNRPEVEVVVATLGQHAGVVGAAMLVFGDAIPEV